MNSAAEATIRCPNAVILIGDRNGELPPRLGGNLVAATETVIAVGTMSDLDGPTVVRIVTGHPKDSGSAAIRVFDGPLTLNGRLSVSDINDQEYLGLDVAEQHVRVEVWVNDPTEPDVIAVVLASI